VTSKKEFTFTFSGASTASIYYLNSSNVLKTSTITNLSNTAKNRFAVLGNKIFRANGVDAMSSSPNGNTWTAVNSGLSNLNVNILKTNGTNLYASVYGVGVFLSTNNGINWVLLNSSDLSTPCIAAMAVYGSSIFVGLSLWGGAFMTNNNGNNWFKVYPGFMSFISAMEINIAIFNIVQKGFFDECGKDPSY